MGGIGYIYVSKKNKMVIIFKKINYTSTTLVNLYTTLANIFNVIKYCM